MNLLKTTLKRFANPRNLITLNRSVTSFRYHEKVIDHYEKPRNVGSFNKSDQDVGTGLVGAPACGDVMKLQIKVNDSGVIENAVFKVRVGVLKYLDFWMWFCHCFLFLCDRADKGQTHRRSSQH